MASSNRTTDHEQIRRWVEARNGKPQQTTAAGAPSRFNRFVSR
jgi:hypothetical protein